MVGEFDEKLKQEIDDVQEYIDILWEQGLDDLVPKWIRFKQELIDEIEEV